MLMKPKQLDRIIEFYSMTRNNIASHGSAGIYEQKDPTVVMRISDWDTKWLEFARLIVRGEIEGPSLPVIHTLHEDGDRGCVAVIERLEECNEQYPNLFDYFDGHWNESIIDRDMIETWEVNDTLTDDEWAVLTDDFVDMHHELIHMARRYGYNADIHEYNVMGRPRKNGLHDLVIIDPWC